MKNFFRTICIYVFYVLQKNVVTPDFFVDPHLLFILLIIIIIYYLLLYYFVFITYYIKNYVMYNMYV